MNVEVELGNPATENAGVASRCEDATPEPMEQHDITTPPAVRITGLSKSFHGHLGIGRTPAVRGLDLEVRTGEILGLLGPNGAGKTTTIKMLLGLLKPDRGDIRLLGSSPSDPAARARVGYLPENPYFYAYLSAEEFLDFYARLQGIEGSRRAEVVRGTLARVGLAGRERVALRKFSKGMVQRVGLAQAIQHDPDLVILDEPMSGLDPVGRREVRDLILSLRASGKTVLFSSHILQDVEMVADRVAILVRGKLRSIGRLDELIAGKVKSYEVSIRGVPPDMVPGTLISKEAGQCLVDARDVRELTRVLTVVQEHAGEVVSIFPRRETLEDLFLQQVGQSGGQS